MSVKKKKRYKSIFFDLDNTIWDFNTNSYEALKIAFKKNNLHKYIPDFNDFYNTYEGINTQLWESYRNKGISKSQLIIERFGKTFDTFGLSHDAINFNNDYLQAMPGQKALVDNAFEVLEYLESKGYQLFIITNGFKEVQLKKLEQSGLAHYFIRIFVSEEVKSHKPDKVIFKYALKSSNSRKQSSLMVGDSWEVDVLGALNAGIDQVHFNFGGGDSISEKERGYIRHSKTATYRINNLKQLKLFL